MRDSDKAGVVDVAKRLAGFGFNIVATGGTHDMLVGAGVACKRVNKVSEGRPSHRGYDEKWPNSPCH